MQLENPVTIQPPPVALENGDTRIPRAITLSNLDITLVDSAAHRICLAQIRPCPKPLVLWEKETYDEIGDYTQAQAEARVMELLGADIKAALEELFPLRTVSY